jgi:enamine deaminase RidA (YjgF/YER057c/UK114 family)
METSKTPEQRIEELGLQLPQASKGIAVYKPVVVLGNIAYTSGQLPLDPLTNQPRKGKLGDGVSVEEGYEAARLCVRSHSFTSPERLPINKINLLLRSYGRVVVVAQQGLSMLAVLKAELGSLNKIKRVVKLVGFVNSTPDFEMQPKGERADPSPSHA